MRSDCLALRRDTELGSVTDGPSDLPSEKQPADSDWLTPLPPTPQASRILEGKSSKKIRRQSPRKPGAGANEIENKSIRA